LEVSLAALDRGFQADEEVTPEAFASSRDYQEGQTDVVVPAWRAVETASHLGHRFTKTRAKKIEKAAAP